MNGTAEEGFIEERYEKDLIPQSVDCILLPFLSNPHIYSCENKKERGDNSRSEYQKNKSGVFVIRFVCGKKENGRQ